MKNNSSVKPNVSSYHDNSFGLSTEYGEQNMSSIKSNSSNEKKCNLYVHQFHKPPKPYNNSNYLPQNWLEGNSVHQSSYKHEMSDYYGAKIKVMKKQFDDLSLSAKQIPSPNPHKLPNANKVSPSHKPSKVPSVKSSPMQSKVNRMFLFRPEHKAAIDKLEETYWSKWKPNKIFSKDSNPKKGLYTENEQPKVYRQVNKTQRKERGDSNQELTLNESEEEEEVKEQAVCIAPAPAPEPLVSHQVQVPEIDSDEITETPNDEDSEIDNNMQISIIKPTKSEEETPSYSSNIIIVQKSSSEISVNLKHTDSFIILSAKKQTEEKQRFQQPKCIKLFKNIGYSSSTPINYIKGGTYPLKSCLKREGSFTSKSSYLSPPSSGMKILNNNRKLGKAFKLSK